MLLSLLGPGGCTPAPPLDPGGVDPDSWILTSASHGSAYGRLGCFDAGCHADAGSRYDAGTEEHALPAFSCVDGDCHGDNGVLDQTLVTGKVFADLAGSQVEQEIVVIAEEVGNPQNSVESDPTDSDGQFSLVLPQIGTFDFVLRDRNDATTRSVDHSMPSLTIGGGPERALDCAECHDGVTAGFLAPIR
ncbi:MAG: hypothetical protein CME06_09930 [Gemmatimonadetes bacterium]|nr:hypothetical protein [Gemmatimonadota bacterium]